MQLRRLRRRFDAPTELALAATEASGEALALIAVEPGPRFRYLEVNDVAVRLAGYSRDEIVGHCLDELLAPDDVVERARVWREVARTQTPATYLLPVTLPVGHRVFETTVSPVVDLSGATKRLVTASRDVTERESALDRADRFEARFETMLAYSSDGFMLTDTTTQIIYASAGCEHLLGLSPPELVGSAVPVHKLHPDDVAVVAAHWQRALEHPREVQLFEVRVRHPDETWRDLAVRLVNELDDPTVASVVATFCDATERRAAEREAARAHSRLQEILAGASDAIVTSDASQTILSFNKAAEEMFGYRAGEVVGGPLELLIPDRVRAAHERHVDAFMASPVGRRLMSERTELSGRRKDGSEFPVEITISRVRVNGDVLLTAIVRDITQRRAAESALVSSEARLRKLMAHSDEVVSIVGRDGSVLWWSHAIVRILGYPVELPEGSSFSVWGLVHPDDRESLEVAFAEAERQPGVPLEIVGRGLHADGSWRWLHATITDRCDDPAVGGIVVNVHDVSHMRRLAAQEAAVAHLGQRALSEITVSALADEAVTAIVQVLDVDLAFHAQVDERGDNLLVRASAGPIDGPTDALRAGAGTYWGRALGADATALPAAGEPPAGTEALREVGIVGGVTVRVEASGEPYGVLGAYATVPREFSPDDTAFLRSVASVLTRAVERRHFERDLEHQMLHDSLTGLPNRMLLDDRLTQALHRSELRGGRVAALLIDLDDFKLVNESLGHAEGDTLLRSVAERLAAAIRPADTLARFGGDEFVVVVETDTDAPDEATTIADSVFAAFQAPLQVTPEHDLYVTASIGIAIGAGPGTTAATLISEADLAMYRAKRSGGDTYVVFDEDLRTRAKTRLECARSLRPALSRNEFHLLYQPEIDLGTGRTADVEALLRWDHPRDGLLAPDVFLDVAEQTGLIVPVGEWTITQACVQAARWQQTLGTGAPQRVFINVSPRQLLHPNFQPAVERALETTGLDPRHLGFEVTEYVFIDDLAGAADILERLHGHGHGLCLDDFGTGYSSLTYLRRLPFDCLKIDKSFVNELGHEGNDTTSIITAIIDMAHDLGLSVTAEGVETPAQAETLTVLGCDRAQGYHYSRPATPEDLEHLLTDTEGPSG